MTQIDLRKAIINRVQDTTVEQLTETIEQSISGDEMALPGLGVLFEIIWQQAPAETQQQMVQRLHEHLHETSVVNATPSY